jgi:hypothetical protein
MPVAQEGGTVLNDTIPATLRAEVSRLERVTFYRAECHLYAARHNSYLHTAIGMLAAALAALAGGTAFADLTVIAGVAGILSAAVTSFLTIYKPDDRAANHWQAARGYNNLRQDLALRFDLGLATGQPRVGASAETPKAESREGSLLPPSGTKPAGDASETPGVPDEAKELAAFERRFRDLENTYFPMLKRWRQRAEERIREGNGWYPPWGEEFERWWTRTSHLSERADRTG